MEFVVGGSKFGVVGEKIRGIGAAVDGGAVIVVVVVVERVNQCTIRGGETCEKKLQGC